MKNRVFFASLALALTAILSQATTAQAGGSLAVVNFGTTLSPSESDLSDATSITASTTFASSTGLGEYSGITAGTAGSAFSLNLTDLSSFTYTIGGLSFTPSALSSEDMIVSRTANAISVYLRGDFGGSDSSIQFTANYNGGSASSSFTIQTPAVPPPVPEPTSVVMGLTSVLGCGLMYVLRRRSARIGA
jgi:hypothetical protein